MTQTLQKPTTRKGEEKHFIVSKNNQETKRPKKYQKKGLQDASDILKDFVGISRLFRIGGDEFVAILENSDYKFRDELFDALNASVAGYIARTDCDPWERFSMAAGMAVFDSAIDKDAESVFKRADQIMYKNKQHMKAEELKEELDEL